MHNHFIKLFISLIIVILSFASTYSIATDIVYNSYTRSEPPSESNLKYIEGAKRVIIKDKSSIDTRNMSLEELEKNMIIDYYNIAQYNSDICGWINIPNIGYYPVMKGTDNDFYLNNNEYKQSSINGSLFMDYRCDIHNDVALIYGHHMASGLMFGALAKYKQEDFFYNNEPVTFFDGNVFYKYIPFSIYLFESRKYAIQLNFDSISEKIEYMRDIANASMFKPDMESYNIKTLFMQTCDYTFNDARLEVAFKMVDKKSVDDSYIDDILQG